MDEIPRARLPETPPACRKVTAAIHGTAAPRNCVLPLKPGPGLALVPARERGSGLQGPFWSVSCGVYLHIDTLRVPELPVDG